MKHSGIIAAGLICLFGAYLLASSFSLFSEAGAALGPAFMPRMLGIILLVLGAANLVEEIGQEGGRRRGEAVAADQPAAEGDIAETSAGPLKGREWIAAHVDVLSIPLLLAYAYSMKPVGFLLSSMVYLFLHMLLLTVNKKRNYLLLAVLAIIVPCIIYFCFVKLFYLMLPVGILG